MILYETRISGVSWGKRCLRILQLAVFTLSACIIVNAYLSDNELKIIGVLVKIIVRGGINMCCHLLNTRGNVPKKDNYVSYI